MTGTATGEIPELDDFNPYNAEFRADPYPAYHRVRELGVAYWPYLDSYVVAAHADAVAVLADMSLRVEPPADVAEVLSAMVPESLRSMQQTVLFRDPPAQSRLRGLTRRTFSSGLREVLDGARGLARTVLAEATRRGELEIVEEFAFPVALQVIGDLLGLPRADLPMLRDLGQAMSPAADIPPAPGSVDRAVEGIEAFTEYFERLAAFRLREPGDDLFSELLDGERAGSLSRTELVANAILIFISGHETLVAFIASAVLTFLRNPDQLDLLRRDPALAPAAVDEVLRYESPLQLATAGGGRWTTRQTVIGGRVVPAGQRVLTLLGAANRDPAVHPDPDRFSITRAAGRHLALGHGSHYCLGAVLAKQQGGMLLAELAGWPAELELTGAPLDWLPLFMQRRLASLPVRLTPR
ncbi:cytochrome P450 [Amycolatopsis sp. YIM 10]|uniref:cytochrome P450 n=1 Tax=Amycolatopsis sp. YIM 10 TaxID=2653857 RepID=UPI0012906177|nr:cytochrome P450 [Amycolatopsis sp. YIM 10]QFU90559.1 Biotin biosynthesis cytochrome P450 [Amycolatopsis sp. YIM 10]